MSEVQETTAEQNQQEILGRLPLSGETYLHEGKQTVELFMLEGSSLNPREIERVLVSASHDSYEHVRRARGRSMIVNRGRSVAVRMGHRTQYRSNVLGISGASYVSIEFDLQEGITRAFVETEELDMSEVDEVALPNQRDFRQVFQFKTTFIEDGEIVELDDPYAPTGSYVLEVAVEKALTTIEVFDRTRGRVLTPKVEAIGLINRDDLEESPQLAFIVYSLPNNGLTWDARFQLELNKAREGRRSDDGIIKVLGKIYNPISERLGITLRYLHDVCGIVHGQIVPSNIIFPVLVGKEERIMLTDWETVRPIRKDYGELQRALEVHKAQRSMLTLYKLPGMRMSVEALKNAFEYTLKSIVIAYNGFKVGRRYNMDTSGKIEEWMRFVEGYSLKHFSRRHHYLSLTREKLEVIARILTNRREVSTDLQKDSIMHRAHYSQGSRARRR